MKKIFALFLMLFLGLSVASYANLTAGYVVLTKNGASNPPTTQNGSIYDTGSASGAGNVGIGTTAPIDPLDISGEVNATDYSVISPTHGIIDYTGFGFTPGNAAKTFMIYPSGNVSIQPNNVGISTVDPGNALVVGGAITATGIVSDAGHTSTGSQTDYVHIPGEEIIATATSITPSGSYSITYQANTQTGGTLTINAPTNTPAEGQSWELIIKSTNVQTFSWNAVFNTGGLTLPTATTGSSKYDKYSFQYNAHSSKFDYHGSSTGN